MVSDLSLVMDVPPNLSERADHISFVISCFRNSLMMSSSILLSNVMPGNEVLLFSGLIGLTISSMLGRIALLRFSHGYL